MVRVYKCYRWIVTFILLFFSFHGGLAANYLCFTAEADNSEVWYVNEANNHPDMQYSTDGGASWTAWEANSHVVLPTVGSKVYIRGNNPNGFSHVLSMYTLVDLPELDCTYFKMKGSIAASGSVMSLIDGEGNTTVIPSGSKGCFFYLFGRCNVLTKAPELPATTLAEGCYNAMFYNCELTEIPKLPATTLSEFCYGNMFMSCSKLKKKPVLSATTLATNCYMNMFAYTGLTEAPDLPATKLTYSCYAYMFREAKKLVKAPELKATELTSYCYEGMFENCTSLTTAPELPAQTLVSNCYNGMFKNCTSLNYIKVGLRSLDNDVNATKDWVSGITQEGLFIFPCGSKYNKHGVSEVPDNFTIVASPIVIFQNPDGKELWRDTIGCDAAPVYNGNPPSMGPDYSFQGWDKPLEVHTVPDVYYYTAVYDYVGAPNYLCFTSESGTPQIGYLNYGGNTPDVQYSLDEGKTWLPLTPDGRVILENVGDKVYFRGNNPDGFSHALYDMFSPDSNDRNACSHFMILGGNVSASGSVMSLIDGVGISETIPCDYCFAYLFYYCGGLLNAPDLTATTLTKYCYDHMFQSCQNLKQASDLPAMTLTEGCYSNMFNNCFLLERAPELPAKTLAKHCYEAMFMSCSKLTQAPGLPATKMADYCYAEMFRSTGLSKAPELPSTALAPYCYNLMFNGCQNLTEAPALPAATLAQGCYGGMFGNCKLLTEAPALPATTLKEGCYQGMFQWCEGLTQAPDLLADALVKDCYGKMFEGCSSLEYIRVGVLSLDNDVDATKDWVSEVNRSGTFVFPCGSTYDKHGASEVPDDFTIVGSPIVIFQNPNGSVLYTDTIDCGDTPVYGGVMPPSAGVGTSFLGWDKELEVIADPGIYYYTAVYENMGSPVPPNCLCFSAGEDGALFTIENVGGNHPNVEYTENGGVTWTPLNAGDMVALGSAGDKVYIRGLNPDGFSHQENVYTQFKTSGKIDVSGSVMSLIDGEGTSTQIPNDYCFAHLFKNTTISNPPSLPAVSLKKSCYHYMFAGCEILAEFPELPAIELAPYCYNYMFAGCLSLGGAGSLPATKLAQGCYNSMFMKCTGLMVAPEELPAMELAEACYANMFYGCESLTRIPNLPAEVLAPSCYGSMFYGCASISEVGLLPASVMADYCYSSMFAYCTSIFDGGKLMVEELADGCFSSMYKGCTSLTRAPLLLSSELKRECYKEMFAECASLDYIEVGVMTLDNDFDATLNWVDGVDGPGLFVFPCGSTYDKHGVSEVPDNFEIKASPILVFLNADDTELWRDTVDCESVPVYGGPTPTYGEGKVFIGWDKDLTTPSEAGLYYYIAQYSEGGDVPPGPWLCFTAEEAGSEIWYTNYGENRPDVQYSVDGGETWQTLSPGEHYTFGEVGSKVYIKGNNRNGFSHSASDKTCFGMSGQLAASGNVMSLVAGENGRAVIPCAHCFDSLFAGCASLTKAPELPAVAMSLACYKNMFSHCTSLKKMPDLPAHVLERECYASMFSYCENLTVVSPLEAAGLAPGCYAYMFQGCSSLTMAPNLMSTDLADSCYYGLFKDCSQLKRAPLLVTDVWADHCYAHMFEGCSSLEYIEVDFMSLDNNVGATENWVAGVDGPGSFIFPCGTKYDKHGVSEVPDNFDIEGHVIVVFRNPDSTELWRDTIACFTAAEYRGEMPPTYKEGLVFWKWDKEMTLIYAPGVYYYTAQYRDESDNIEGDWLCFTAEAAGSGVAYSCILGSVDMEYSVDGGKSWESWGPNQKVPLDHVGDQVYVRGYNPDGAGLPYLRFSGLSGRIAASGSIMSLVDGVGETTVIPCERCFNSLFADCSALTKAPRLPATTLTLACYSEMFMRCMNLKEAPALPATEMRELCYSYMFAYCDSLKTAPALPATKLDTMCYGDMFRGCESLVNPPALPATSLAPNCYSYMFFGCSALKKAPDLPATTLAMQCYMNMFSQCTGLIQAPELSATELATSCCAAMFLGCSSLSRAPELPATEMKPSCYTGMFSQCTSLTRAPELPAMILAESCYHSMFYGCASLTQAPELPATELKPSCYNLMFFDCISLVQAPELPAPELEAYCYNSMFANCRSLTLAPELPATELKPYCYMDMFSNCENLTYIKVGVMSLDNDMRATDGWVVGVDEPGTFIFPCGSRYDRRGVSEVPWNFTIVSSPIVIFQNPDSTVLWQDTIDCNTIPEYGGATPTYGEQSTFLGWDPEPTLITDPDVYYFTAVYEKQFDPSKCLHFTAEEAGSQIWYSNAGDVVPDVWYSLDEGKSWKKLDPSEKITLENVGDKVYLKGNNPNGFNWLDADSLISSNEFKMSGLIAAGGSIMSLIDGKGESTVIPNEYCFDGLFKYCNSLTHAPELPATTLMPHCYQGMFYGCDNLIQAPDLPATKLVHDCYHGMFIGCESLKTAPELPATELVENCYIYMFNGCVQLNYVKVGVMSLDNEFNATAEWVDGTNEPGTFIFPCGSKYDKHGYSEVPVTFKIVSSPIVVFQNPGGAELWRDTIDCKTVPEYKGEEPFIGENYTFVGWDNELTVLPIPDTYYFTALYEEKEPLAVTDSAIVACDSFAFKGITYRESASWNDTLTSTEGADHVIAYHLTIHKGVTTDTIIKAEGNFSWRGVTYTENASWNDTLQTVNGCDSIVRINLIINGDVPALVTDTSIAACDSYVYKGVTYTENASWNDTLTTTDGGYRILAYHLTLHKSVTTDTTITAEESFTWKKVTYTESASWNDTLQTVNGCDSIVHISLIINGEVPTPVTDTSIAACGSYVYKGVTYSENSVWSDTLTSSDGGDRILTYHLTIHRGSVVDTTITAEGSYTWKGTTYTEDASWSDTLQTIHGCDSIVRYSLTIEKEKPNLQLTVEEKLYLVLPGGSETISYELTGGEGSKYEVRYEDKTLCSGDVTNDSTVSLTCPSSLEPGAYTATLEMCDGEGNCAEKEFTFNVMLPDNKRKSYYVKVWNDVVICRNADGQFQTFQWYKDRRKCENAAQQYLNDVNLLDGEYMVYVTDKDGKSYFIEPIVYAPVEAAYAITAEPNVVAKGTEFTVKVSGVAEEDLKDARIVVYRANGVVEKLLDEVELEKVMRLKSGEYVIVLTVNDGKNANCKVLVK